MSRDEKDYASKGAAYGIGIPALVLGGLAVLNSGNNCGGNGGILGGVFGGNGNNCWQMQYALNNERRLGRMEAVPPWKWRRGIKGNSPRTQKSPAPPKRAGMPIKKIDRHCALP